MAGLAGHVLVDGGAVDPLYYRDVACTRTDRHHSCAKNAGTSGCCTSARFLWSQ